MIKLLKYLLLSFCVLFFTGGVAVGTDDTNVVDYRILSGQLIESFRNSLGFSVLEEGDSTAVLGDSLLAVLEKNKEYGAYFELSRIIIKSQVSRGETRMAIAQSDMLYSKAKAQNDVLGMALSFNAIGEVYMAIGRNKEAGGAYGRSWELLNKYRGDESMKKILLVELTEYELRMGNMDAMAKHLALLNRYPVDKLSVLEQTVLHIFNAYYRVGVGELAAAGKHLEKVRESDFELMPGLQPYFLGVEAFYLRQKGDLEDALKVYDRFFELKPARNNYSLYVGAMEGKAALLEKMGRKKEAFNLYYTIYSYVDSVFKANYPKEIDQLCARFQADQLTYQIEQARSRSLCYYMMAIAVSALVLILLLFLGWRKIFRLRQSKKNLEEMKQRAENAIRKKNLFLSNMSHEVRTPLNAIVGFSTLMASEEIEVYEDSRKEYCEIIKVNSYQLLKLINDIIDFSDFDEDTISMNIREYDAVKICREVIETVAASYKLQVELRFDTPLASLMMATDDSRLRQVLINLLVNATKFTSEGSIVLRLDLNQNEDNMAFFSVTDTGCGIPLEKQKLIFERFEKLNDFVQGTGLGLSICLLIMKRLKGRIWIDGEYTEGARFCFVHPLKNESDLHSTAS